MREGIRASHRLRARLFVSPAGHLKAELSGSTLRNVERTRSLVTLIPLAQRLPHIILTPEYGASCLIILINDVSS